MSGSGHSGNTVRRHYILGQRQGDAAAVLAVSAIMHGTQPISSPTSVERRRAITDTYLPSLPNAIAPYLVQPVIPSSLSMIGEWHPDKRDAVTEGRSIRVTYCPLELGYIGNWIRERDALMGANRKFKEAVGDYKVAR